MTPPKGPVTIDLQPDGDAARPDLAPPVPDTDTDAALALPADIVAPSNRPAARLMRWIVLPAFGLAMIGVGQWLWGLATGLLAANPVLGGIVTALVVVMLVAAILAVLREVATLSRMRRIDGLRRGASAAIHDNDLGAARDVVARVTALYDGRADMRWATARMGERQGDVLDADALLHLAEDTLLAPLDAAATREVEAAARQVATVTALVPLALADVVAALVVNLRMIRRIASIYGGRSGFWGNMRLVRRVTTHLAATGAVAIGDDMLEPILGGSVLSKLSRRFGEGVVNGALTARVGAAALEICRPLPFDAKKRPPVRQIVKRALTGLFGKS